MTFGQRLAFILENHRNFLENLMKNVKRHTVFIHKFVCILLLSFLAGIIFEIFVYLDEKIYPSSIQGVSDSDDMTGVVGMIFAAISLLFIPMMTALYSKILPRIRRSDFTGFLWLGLATYIVVMIPIYFLTGMTSRSLSSNPLQLFEFSSIIFSSALYYWFCLRTVK